MTSEINIKRYDYEMLDKLYRKALENPPVKNDGKLTLHGLESSYHNEKDRLQYVCLYISHKCQINCIYCSKHYDMEKVERGELDVLSYDEICKFIDEAKKCGLKTLIFQGMAEPTEDPHFRDYIEYADKRGITSIVFSNILNLDDSLAQFLYDHDVSIAPSIDSLDRDIYNFLTRSSEYDRFIRSVGTLKKYFGGRSKWAGKSPRVLVSMVVTEYNVQDLDSIRTICNENDWLLCSKAFGVKGSAKTNFDSLAGDNDSYGLLQKLAIMYADKVMITQTSAGKCACGGKSGFLVDIDGHIGACGDSITRVDANIRTNTIKECLTAKMNYVSGLGDYVCLSKALRGFGDVKIASK